MKRIVLFTILAVSLCSATGHATPVSGTSTCAGAFWQGTLAVPAGSFVPTVAYLDWAASGDANLSGLAPAAPGGRPSAVVGQKFILRIQSRLGTINATTRGAVIPFSELNASFEYTMVASIPCEVAVVRNLSATRTFVSFKTATDGTTPGRVTILNSPVNAQDNGAGFDDGEIVMQLTVPTGQSGTFTYDASSGITGTLNITAGVADGTSVNPAFVHPANFIQSVNTESTIALSSAAPAVYFATGNVFPTYTPGTGDLNLKLDAISSFGCRCSGTIGDLVWSDQNGNGVQDVGEPGLDGVGVTLSSSDGIPISVQTTSQNLTQHGFYQFSGLCTGTYTVEVNAATAPAAYTPTRIETGDISLDSNASPAPITLATDSSSDATIDFGFMPPNTCRGNIGDLIWHDANHNGIQDDAASEGVDAVTVRLYDNVTGRLLGTTVSGPVSGVPHGSYTFSNLCAGEYRVEVDGTTIPTGFTPVTSAEGIDAALDSSLSPVVVTLAENTSVDQTVDFGYVSPCTGSIGDRVWHDENRNGVQDVGEAGMAGITMRLFRQGNAEPVGTTTTGSQGYYLFSGLCAGNYTVAVDESTLPAGYGPTSPLAGGDPALDSNGTPASVTLAHDAAAESGIDFGYLSPCTGIIGDFVWEDMDGNGVQDAGEGGIAAVIVTLKDRETNAVLKSAVTDAEGGYRFTGVCAGSYKVEVKPPDGYALTLSGSPGSTPETDSNPNPASVVLGTDAGSDLTVDFGLYRPAAIGDLVWNDRDGDGSQDEGEDGLGGWTVSLKRDGVTVATTVTAGGSYSFAQLLPGTYTVCVVPACGYGQTFDLDGLGSPHCATVTLVAGECRTDVDFGYVAGMTTVGTGSTATIGFWHNKNGQALIKAVNGGATATRLAAWLASSFPNLYGAGAGANNLAGKTNADVAALFLKFFSAGGAKVDAQILAAALACYVTNPDLAGYTAASYGFRVSSASTATKFYNVRTSGTAIGLSNNTSYTVYALLQQANLMKGGSFAAGAFNTIFDGINQAGDIK